MSIFEVEPIFISRKKFELFNIRFASHGSFVRNAVTLPHVIQHVKPMSDLIILIQIKIAFF